MTEKPSRSDARLLRWAYFSLQRRRSPRSKSRVCVIPGYVVSSWEDSLISGSFSGYKRSRDIVGLNQTELQEGNVKNNQVSGLTHQFSLPKTSSEIATIEKFLQFQDSVPCKIRAKRGCATRPRNIAERVRRTRISERIILTVIDIVIDYYCLPVLAAE